jgi:hypothetical protein
LTWQAPPSKEIRLDPFIARDVPGMHKRLKIPDKISKNGKILTKLSVKN